jgi:hypothetical protein
MPQIVTHISDAYSFDELSAAAKERARDWYRSRPLDEDFECTIEDFTTIGNILGIDFDTHEVKLMSGKSRSEPDIWWSLSHSQGDGACFEGRYNHTADSCAKIREHAPQDEELHRIADELNRIQSARVLLGKSTWEAVIKKTGHHYSHEHTVLIDVNDAEGDEDEPLVNEDVDTIGELMRDLMRWLHKALRDEDEYRNSDECVDENIEANEYMFDEDGDRHDYA